MIGFKVNRSIPTTLKLNGPTLGYLEQVTDAEQHISGVVTFSGIATATYPADNVEGTFDFKWYLDDAELNSSMTSPSVSIVSVGNSSILTLDNIPLANDNSRVYLKTDYIPASGEAQANNEPLQSDTGRIELVTDIQILTQPVTQNVASGNDVSFSVDAQLENGSEEGLEYQWYFDGSVKNDSSAAGFTYSGTNTDTVTVDVNDNVTTGGPAVCISVLGLTLESESTISSDWNSFRSSYPNRPFYILQPTGFANSLLKVPSSYNSDSRAYGIQTISLDEGDPNQATDWFSITGMNSVPSGTSVSLSVDDSVGGPINITDNQGSISISDPTTTLSQISITRFINVSGGTENHPIGSIGYFINFGQFKTSSLEVFLTDTRNRASGMVASDNSIAVSSGYPQKIDENTYKVAFDMTNSVVPGARQATLVRNWGFNFVAVRQPGGAGNPMQVRLRASMNQFNKKCRDAGMNLYFVTMSGERWAFDHNRSLPEAGGNSTQNLFCRVTHPQSFNSPQDTNTVSMTVVAPRPLINFEAYTFQNNYQKREVNFDNTSEFTLDQNTFGSQYSIIQFHSVEKNNAIIMNMFGSKGGGSNGGEGGTATIKFTADKGVEYTLIGISNSTAVFLYRGSQLIAVVGEGGASSSSGTSGGAGGGVSGSGSDGGSNGNSAGQYANLSLNGVYGSTAPSSVTLQSGDTRATQNLGGKSISCTKGSYWINQAISACSNNSSDEIQFVNVDGTNISSSSSIIRGFKPGYTITTTAGAGVANGGRGGNGAVGGKGGTNSSSGGGGGSGYNNGTVDVVSTRLGGSTGIAKVTMRVEASKFVHFFNNRVNPKVTTSLTGTGNITGISALNSAAGSPGDLNAKHYLITMDADYTGLTIDVTSPLTAAGGATDPNMYAASIQKQNSTQWRVWFVRGNGTSNTFIREATIIGNL